MEFIAFLKENWTVITQAPWAFAVCAALFGGAGLLLGRFWLSERVANLESRIARRDEIISDLEKSLSEQPQSPDRKAMRIALAGLAKAGRMLKERVAHIDGEELEKAVSEWATSVTVYLGQHLDESYSHRFLSDSGFSPLVLFGTTMTQSQQNASLWIDRRIARLDQFMTQLS